MTNSEIKYKAKQVLARAMKVDVGELSDDISQADLSDWDSVRHMNVVIGLENEFNIEFKDSDLPKLVSLPLMVEAIERQLAE
jgi:acyl carrier protein